MKLLLLSFLLGVLLSCNSGPTVPSSKDELDKSIHALSVKIDKQVKYELIYRRMRDLKDSSDEIYIRYSQGKTTYADYSRAFQVQIDYYNFIFKPAFDSL